MLCTIYWKFGNMSGNYCTVDKFEAEILAFYMRKIFLIMSRKINWRWKTTVFDPEGNTISDISSEE